MSVVPVASEQAYGTCANCGSALVADQRYCLECGAPASPVRLAFLDVLQSGQDVAVRSTPAGYEGAVVSAAGVLPVGDPYGQAGMNGWLRRNSGILSLLSVLALCLIAGLLIGHWATRGGAPAKQVVELKGNFPAAAAAAPTTPGAPGASSASKSSSSNSAGAAKAEEEAEEKGEAKETAAEKAPPPPAKKVNIKKLSTTTGKKHTEELNALGAQPIETG